MAQRLPRPRSRNLAQDENRRGVRGGRFRWWPDQQFETEHIQPQQDARYEADAWEDAIDKFLAGRKSTTVLVSSSHGRTELRITHEFVLRAKASRHRSRRHVVMAR
jgi:hypothetical protein